MTPENFAFWLQGFFELTDTDDLTPAQVMMVKDHLKMVFTKVTPDRAIKKKSKKARKVKVHTADEVFSKKPFESEGSLVDPTVTAEDTRKAMEKARKQAERMFPSPNRWVGGGRGQTYC